MSFVGSILGWEALSAGRALNTLGGIQPLQHTGLLKLGIGAVTKPVEWIAKGFFKTELNLYNSAINFGFGMEQGAAKVGLLQKGMVGLPHKYVGNIPWKATNPSLPLGGMDFGAHSKLITEPIPPKGAAGKIYNKVMKAKNVDEALAKLSHKEASVLAKGLGVELPALSGLGKFGAFAGTTAAGALSVTFIPWLVADVGIGLYSAAESYGWWDPHAHQLGNKDVSVGYGQQTQRQVMMQHMMNSQMAVSNMLGNEAQQIHR